MSRNAPSTPSPLLDAMSKKGLFPLKPHSQSLSTTSEQEKLFWVRAGETFFQVFQLHLDGQHYYKAVCALHQATACYYTALILSSTYEQQHQVEELLALLRELSGQPREVICPHALAALAQCVFLVRGLSELSCAALCSPS
ncbi:MAG: hypothetical protein ROO73_02240 [Roseivirga sp.]